MLKSTTNADCPYFVIQGYLSSLEFNHRAALAVIIKVIKELFCRHDFSPSLCRFGLGLSMKKIKIRNSVMPQRHDECGLTVFLFFRKPDLTFRISQKSDSPWQSNNNKTCS